MTIDAHQPASCSRDGPSRAVAPALSALSGFMSLMFPGRCAVCRAAGISPCRACAARLAQLPAAPGAEVAGVDRVVACFDYRGPVRPLIAGLKYGGNRAALGWLGVRLAEAWVAADLAGTVTWAPTTPGRVRRRGFDQSELLARALHRASSGDPPEGAGVGPPVALLCRRRGPAQTGRSAGERAGVAPFALRRGHHAMPERVVLVDDVLTTGATLASAAAVLRAGGCRHVDALVVARVRHDLASMGPTVDDVTIAPSRT